MIVGLVVVLIASIVGNAYGAWYIGKLRADKAKQKELATNEVKALGAEFTAYKSTCYCKDVV